MVYCTVVLDTFSRRVMGWSIDSSQTAALVTNALSVAIASRHPQAHGVTHRVHVVGLHRWRQALWTDVVHGSMGDCHYPAMIESSWGRMQTELLNRKRWKTRIELANGIFDYLDTFHQLPTSFHPWDAHSDKVLLHQFAQRVA